MTTHDTTPTSFAAVPISVPVLSAEKFAELVGLPVGVVKAQMDRRILPCLKIGKRRVVNMEALRKLAEEQ